MGMVESTLMSTYGTWEQGQAQAASARYNAAVEHSNALISTQNAAIAGQAGSEQAFMTGLKTRSMVGSLAAHQGASGVDVNSGSNVDTRASADALGELDALTVRSNAAREAYGYQTQATAHEAQSRLDKTNAKNSDTASYVNAASTFLSGMSNAADKFASFQMAGGFGG